MVERSLSMREVRGSIPRISKFFLSPHIFRHSPATVPSMQTDGGSADASMAPQAVFSVLLSRCLQWCDARRLKAGGCTEAESSQDSSQQTGKARVAR
jgi:hypothetical protein